MFGRSRTPEPPAADSPESSGSHAAEADVVPAQPVQRPRPAQTQGKGAPTPKRSEQQAARKRPLVPDDRKAAKTAQRQAVAAERQKVRVALETGDERNLPARDSGPQRRFARDWVDARTGIGEWLMIIVLVYIFVSFIPAAQMALFLTFSLWALVILVVFEGIWVSRSLKHRLTAKFGEVERGVRWYGVMRTLQMRRLRLPKPQVKRGQFPS